jgi:hypothetical protein
MLFYPVYSECDCVSRLGRTRLRPAEEPFVDYVVDRRELSGDIECGDESWTLSKRIANTSAANSVPKVNRHEDSMFVMIVFVPYGLVSIGLKPSTDSRHRSRKLSGA